MKADPAAAVTGNSASVFFLRDEQRSEFLDEVKRHRTRLSEISPGIFFGDAAPRFYWVLDYWPHVERVAFSSISDAAKKLRAIAPRWVYAGGVNFRRGKLIAEALRIRLAKSVVFPQPAGNPAVAAFTLENPETLLYTRHPLKGSFAGGRVSFEEDKKGPPSRAYLKLWEILTLTETHLTAEDQVLDLGATPGGWSYVAASLGCHVTMIDRSPPDQNLLRRFPGLQFRPGDGLQVADDLLSAATVILSDMACEPAKLWLSVRKWLEQPRLRAMICTLKFHGLSDKAVIAEFAGVPGSEIYHLWHNGHELTWYWRRFSGP